MRALYQHVLKPILFRFDPERVHDVFVSLGEGLGRTGVGRGMIRALYGYRGPDAAVHIDGLHYRTPIVLAAGFDYDGRLVQILPELGFGGVEVGSVTARPCAGNEPPRLRRLIRSQSLVVNKGLKNEGVEAIARRLAGARRQPGFVLGVSIARTNDEAASTLEGGIADYRESLETLVREDVGDYYTINISCPNVHGGESFASPGPLEALMRSLGEVEHGSPVYVKMPINTTWEEHDALLRILDEAGVAGVIIGNLNKAYDEIPVQEEAPEGYRGGISGRACAARSTDLVRRTRDAWGQRFTIVACGGVLSAADAEEKLDAGADLIQLITGMIFEGPHLMGEIARAAAERREERSSASEAGLGAASPTSN